MSDYKALYERLAKLPVAVMSDVLTAMGLPDQVLESSIRPFDPNSVIAGQALCLSGREGAERPVAPGASKPVYEMDRHVTPGCIAVIASAGHRRGAMIGGNVALAWKLRGCAGVVTDGGVRDVAEFAEFAMPVFGAFTTPMATKGLWNYCAIDVPVALPGQTGSPVRIASGDAIHGDRDGVVVIPAAHFEQAVRDAEIFESMEKGIQRDLKTGEDREAVYKRYDKLGHIKPVAR
jgi:4-hydroxy-4-methyl-2-oxoglutarate aldolase